MHAVVTTVRLIVRRPRGSQGTGDPARVSGSGFVAGYWTNIGGDRGASMAVYESEEDAKQAVERFVAPPGEIITIESMDVGEVVEQA
jgi:hypothetical protein